MSKHYEIQVKFDKNWHWIKSETQHKDALHNLKQRVGDERYPMRIVRVVKTVVFSEAK